MKKLCVGSSSGDQGAVIGLGGALASTHGYEGRVDPVSGVLIETAAVVPTPEEMHLLRSSPAKCPDPPEAEKRPTRMLKAEGLY